MARETVIDLANRVLSSDEAPKAREAHRLADFILDHADHLDFDKARPAKVETPALAASGGLMARVEHLRSDDEGDHG